MPGFALVPLAMPLPKMARLFPVTPTPAMPPPFPLFGLLDAGCGFGRCGKLSCPFAAPPALLLTRFGYYGGLPTPCPAISRSPPIVSGAF